MPRRPISPHASKALLVAVLLPLAALPAAGSTASAAERMTPELLWKLGRLGGAVLSPDGARVAYGVRRYDLAANEGTSSLWVVPVSGGSPRRLLDALPSLGDLDWGVVGGKERIFFAASRKKDVDPQVWSIDPSGGEPLAVTAVEGGVDSFRLSPNGARIAFTRRVRLDPELATLFPDLPEANARLFDSLMYRHWNRWNDGTYRHLHVAELGAGGKAGEARDLMGSLRFECPVPPFAGREHYAWSPDGEELAFVSKIVGRPEESTDSDVYLARADGTGRIKCITAGREGYDNDPVWSPDGRKILFHSMARAGFESDRNRVMLFDRDRKDVRELTEGLDRSAHGTRWSPDGRSIWFSSEHRGTVQVFRLDLRSRELTRVSRGRYDHSLVAVSPDGKRLLVSRQSMLRPKELVVMEAEGGDARPLTDLNGRVYAGLDLPAIEERWVRSSDGAKVQSWVIYPPGFDPEKRWPLITYCQGGPQGQIGQWFSYRWNFHLMAARGYVVLAVNRRGLPGFGRKWNDDISRHWGGQAMRDILAATDSMLAEPWIDSRRTAAVGASFGGYTVYWLMGHDAGRFKAMIAHCGVFNLESMYGETEELFFVNWDLGGPYWKSAEVQRDYDRFSPHRFVGRWKTPLLVIGGQKDFRVPVTQAMEAFTAAQVQGVPSRFLYFPEEGHWVLGPQNGVLWHRVFFDWLDRWCGPGPREVIDPTWSLSHPSSR